MNPETVAELESLIQFLETDIRYYEQSRLLHMSPAERSQRIRQRKRWITAIQRLATEIEARQ